MSRCRVKICGITRRQDAEAAADAGADAIGLVFYPPSPRHVELEVATEIVGSLPPFVVPVGVFVDRPTEEILTTCREAGLVLAQVHGALDPSQIRSLRRHIGVVAALRLAKPADLARWRELGSPDAVLFDAHVPGGLPGGTGTAFPWEWLATEDRPKRTILAGGLCPENVAQAIAKVRPFAVDVSSGVETAPGEKSIERIEAFLAAVRRAERG